MRELKPLDYKLLFELIKNSRRSDRTLAKVLNSSQPTITRRRARLEKDFIEEYTAIPKWEKIGFKIAAFTFVKSKIKYVEPEKRKEAFAKVREWLAKQPSVILALAGQGMGWDGVCVSFHKDYSHFIEFIGKHNSELSEFLVETQSFVSDLNCTTFLKTLNFRYLAETR